MLHRLLFALCLVTLGCGGATSTAETTTTARRETTREPRREERLPEGASITGLMGTISASAVRGALDPRMDRFARCFSNRMAEVEFLSGDITMEFRIHTDGTVAWVYPTETTIGDRETESCILGVARSVHFPEPTGGEAEFTWGFGMDAPADVRQPVSWTAEAVRTTVESNRSSVAPCGRSGFRLTAYVAPGGAVMAVGGAAPDADALPALDCVVAAVRGWTMPNPGSYAAKVSFEL